MKAEGMLFLSRTPPTLRVNGAGEWVLTLLCVDRIANHQTEPWKLLWKGGQAAEWMRAHKPDLQPGTPLAVVVENVRARPIGPFAEAVAQVVSVSVVKKAESP